ncbi:non-specific lipid transfer protein GPI-anchored 7-like [Diospyros lotus]|uniref:non-specific lipid transfer protein GPI-anchored 7-like n=1 Tax=Diospyros lotus TaxID=55363 RepID=UPI002259FC00|nr:non-specific lipid transfer protein GPI-anchored 7-like [Diospyros lotus]
MGYFKNWGMAVAVALVVTAATRGAEAQAPTTSCASKLAPCANSMNSTNPPASCCDPLKEVVTKELSCLCNLYNTPGLLESLGINSTQAVLLLGSCKIPGDISACSKASAPAPASKSPPATPGNGNNGVRTIGWTGIPGILLVWASMILC